MFEVNQDLNLDPPFNMQMSYHLDDRNFSVFQNHFKPKVQYINRKSGTLMTGSHPTIEVPKSLWRLEALKKLHYSCPICGVTGGFAGARCCWHKVGCRSCYSGLAVPFSFFPEDKNLFGTSWAWTGDFCVFARHCRSNHWAHPAPSLEALISQKIYSGVPCSFGNNLHVCDAIYSLTFFSCT